MPPAQKNPFGAPAQWSESSMQFVGVAAAVSTPATRVAKLIFFKPLTISGELEIISWVPLGKNLMFWAGKWAGQGGRDSLRLN